MSDLGLKDTAALQGELKHSTGHSQYRQHLPCYGFKLKPPVCEVDHIPPSLKNPSNMGLGAYLDLALIFLLFRFSLLILFFLHLALIALAHFSCRSESSNKSLVPLQPPHPLLPPLGPHCSSSLLL